MAILRIRDHEVDVNIREELEEYDWGHNAKWLDNKLIASSPFRVDSRPSFYIDFEGEYAGVWGDSGASTDYEASGTFLTLLAYLRSESYEDTEEYLLDKYGVLYDNTEDIRLPELTTRRVRKDKLLRQDLITPAVSPYLRSRGITVNAQILYGTGYNPDRKGYTALPWYNLKGELSAVKYRSTSGKNFFYEKEGTPISRMVYGLNLAQGADEAVIVEGEIDALSWSSSGVLGIALGSASINRYKIDMIRRSGIKKLILGGDNDDAGRLMNDKLKRLLTNDFELSIVDYEVMKDANDVLRRYGPEGLRVVYERRTILPRIEINL